MQNSELITKSDFLRYLECPAYFWFFKNKPEVLDNGQISDFQLQLIKNGEEVEEWARKMFPKGVLVSSREEMAVKDTDKYLDEGQTVIFQATFVVDGLYAMVDILEWDDANDYWVINEVKGTSSKEVKKDKHIKDAAFQYVLLNKLGLHVGRVNLVELNKEFRKDGEINVYDLLSITDVTQTVLDQKEEIETDIENMKYVLAQSSEPLPCDCIYKSRANHCPAFKYLYPNVPDYGVHDIVRIGSSLKRLEGLIESDCLEFIDVPDEYELTDYQRNHVDVEQRRETLIDKHEISKQLESLSYPLYFLDYETIPTAIPIYDGCTPYQQVPFQYSLHVQESPSVDPVHYEYVHTSSDEHPMVALATALMKVMGDSGNVVVWNQKFESKCHEDLAELLPEYADVFKSYNERMYDLMEIFSKQRYLHHDFKGSFSIKVVLPVLVPTLSYNDLNVRDGAMAMNAWKKMMFEVHSSDERDAIKQDLLRYCELDTLAMVEILQALYQL